MSGFGDWITLSLTPMAAFDHVDELNGIVRERLARDIERRVKGVLDPGIDPKRAVLIGSLRVTVDGDDFVIKPDDSQAALNIAEASVKNQRPGVEANDISDLFEMSSGVPEVRDGKLIYKTVSLDTLFGTRKNEEQTERVGHVVEDVARTQLPDAYATAFEETNRRHPTTIK